MKKTHILAGIIGILIVLGLIALPNLTQAPQPANEFVGTWRGGNTGEEGQQWWMQYDIQNETYTVTTSNEYLEEGTYVLGEEYLDGSVEFIKTYNEGANTYTMIFVKTDNPDVITLEGVTLTRTSEE